MGRIERDLGRLDDAERTLNDAMMVWSQLYPDRHRLLLGARADLAKTLALAGRDGEAEAIFREVLEKRRGLPRTSRNLARSIHDLGEFLGSRGRLDESEELLKDALERRRAILWNRNPDLATTLLALADTLKQKGQLEAARRYSIEASEICREVISVDHPLAKRASQQSESLKAAAEH